VTATTSSTSNTLQSLGLTQQASQSGQPQQQQLTQADFLTLLTQQMQDQDPTSPMDNNQLLAQLAQFASVQGIQSLQQTVTSLASSLATTQTLQAAQLVGRSVLVPSSTLTVGSSGGATGSVDLTQSVSNLTVQISTPAGQVVRTISMQNQGPGLVDFTWDGLNDAGKAVAPGQYQVSAKAAPMGGTAQSFSTYALAPVDNVSIDPTSGQAEVNAGQLGSFQVSQIRQIR